MRADDVYAILKGKIVKLTEDIKEVGDWKPIRHQGTVQTAEDLPADAKEGYMYNIATDSVYGAAGMNVVKTADGWDPMGPIVNMDLYLSKEEAKKGYQPAGDYLTENKAKKTYQPVGNYSTKEETEKKLNKNQGIDNAGKITGINADGDIVPVFPTGVQYNEETNLLEFGTDPNMLNKGIQLDATLKKSGYAADSAAVGENIDSLKEDISTKITKFYASSQGETHLADSDDGKIMDMMVYGKSEQKQYTGKNLFDKSTSKSAWISDDGIYIEKGEIGENTDVVSDYISVKENSTYIASFKTNYVANLVYWCTYNANKEFVSITKIANKITIPTGIRYVRVMISMQQQYCVAVNDELQVELGTEPTTYEPYTGGQPSPSPDYPQEIKSVVNPTVKVWTDVGTAGKYLTFEQIETIKDKLNLFYNKKGVLFRKTLKVYPSEITDLDGVTIYWFYNDNNSLKYVSILPSGAFGNAITIGNISDIAESNGDLQIYKGLASYGVYYFSNTEYKTVSLETTLNISNYTKTEVTLPYDLYGVKVPSGGNVTINDQQYVSDYFDVERGKLVRMCKELVIKNATFTITIGTYSRIAVYNILSDRNITSRSMCSHSINKDGFTLDESHWYIYNGTLWIFLPTTEVHDQDSLDAWLENNDLKILVTNEAPEEIDLTDKEIKALKSLATYYPTTNISVNSEQLDGYTVFNYPISMENGWNYVKQQIGDTREYIYDMDARTQDIDTQSAEAYVNSEYAVALTELEV